MGTDREALTLLAEAVADRKPVDWSDATDTPEGMRRQLQVIEALGAVHQAPADTGSDAGLDHLHTEMPAVADGLLETWGHLRILERIGRGGFGDVYRAHDPQLDRHVALKLLRPELSEDETSCRRFIQEARRQARVRHPNVVVVHGADRHDGRVGLWMDLVKGQTLEERLQQQGVFGPEEAALIGIEICRALAAVHGAGLIHRDVKTSNVMRQEGGQIVLMDFSAVSERAALENKPRSESISGTPLFMAPEVLDGKPAGTSVDIYSLGVVLYRLVTAAFPVEAKRISELRDKHQRGEGKPLRDARADLPAPFVQAVDRALAPDPGDRYASVGEFERTLASVLGKPLVSGELQGERPWWRKSGPLALLAAAAMAIVLVIYWPPPVPVPFHIEPALFRLGSLVPEVLSDGGAIAPGDRLFLDIQGSTDLYVYILDEDEQGGLYVLFPLPGLEKQNPLAGKERHRLPGILEGEPNFWKVTSAGGAETVLVIASRTPLDQLEREIEGLPRARPGMPLVATPGKMKIVLRGIGGLEPGPALEPGDETVSIAQILSRASSRLADDSNIRYWERRLTNDVGAGTP
ncbi:MAG: serine/threonine-protein kinase [Acidobacteria bacterium]|nr:serine/threonine-protein kinase [Acidobacteriota bacterium]